ncbi:MAG: class I SAM-dependent methyltransferase [bacterium]
MKNEHWSQYWTEGNLTSLPQDFKENYDGAIASFWNAVFEDVPQKASIIDVCTGNCAIAILVDEFAHSKQKKWEVTAIDASEINKNNIILAHPDLAANLNRIKLKSHSKVESLTEQSCYDLVTSQYGIEYCDWGESAKKIAKILKPDGRFCFVSHSGSTDIAKYMKAEQQDYHFLYTHKLFALLKSYLENRKSAQELRVGLTKISGKIQAHYPSKPSPLIVSIYRTIQQIMAMNDQALLSNKKNINRFNSEHLSAFQRMRDVLDVTQKIADNKNWYQVFIDNGLQLIEKRTIFQDDKFDAGTAFTFMKRSEAE